MNQNGSIFVYFYIFQARQIFRRNKEIIFLFTAAINKFIPNAFVQLFIVNSITVQKQHSSVKNYCSFSAEA